MDNKPESSKDGDGVPQNEGNKRKAEKSQDQDISKKLRALDFTKLSEAQVAVFSEMLKQVSTEPEVLEKKSEVIVYSCGPRARESGSGIANRQKWSFQNLGATQFLIFGDKSICEKSFCDIYFFIQMYDKYISR